MAASHASNLRWDPLMYEPFDAANNFVDMQESEIFASGLRLGRLRWKGSVLLADDLAASLELPTASFHAFLLVATEFNRQVARSWRLSRVRGNLEDVMVELHAQGLAIGEEILALVLSGFAQAAEARWRALFELQMTNRLISDSDDLIARRYKASHVVERWGRITRGDFDALPESQRATFDRYRGRVEKEYEKVVVRYGRGIARPYGWAEPALGRSTSFSSLAKRVLEQDEDHLWLRYIDASHHTHGARIGSTLGLQVERSPMGPWYSPKPSAIGTPVMDTIRSLEELTVKLGTEVHFTHGGWEVAYWTRFCEMISLDVQTEMLFREADIDAGFLHRTLFGRS